MTTYTDARQAVRHVCRELLGLSQPQADCFVDALENFFGVRQLDNEPGTPPALPSVGKVNKARDGR